MICKCCKIDKKKGDFVLKSKECYKCVYKDKMELYSKRRKDNFCKVCGQKCAKSRWSYCSEICSEHGSRERKREYWTMKLRKVEA